MWGAGGTNCSFRSHRSPAVASPRGSGRTRGRDWVCSRVPPEPIWKEIICANTKHIPTCCREFGVGEAVLPLCVFISKSRLFSSSFAYLLANDVCSGTLSECLHVARARTMTAGNYFVCLRVAPRKHVHIRRGQWGGGLGGLVVEGLQNHGRADGLFMRRDTHTQIVHLAFCPITGNIEPKGSGPISKESACNERSEARFYHRQ